MFLLDLTLHTLAENLALDETLLLQAEQGSLEVLRFWEWPQPAVILGAGCQLALDVDELACQMDSVPLLRRSSGGGTVLLGKGCLLYSLVLSFERDPQLQSVRGSYAWILQQMIAALGPLGLDLKQAGISDIALGPRKVSGNSQQRKRTHLLHHGTLLYGFNAADVERYLRLPIRQPEYRHQRKHRDFLGNLPATAALVTSLVRQGWKADEPLSDWSAESVRQLVQQKYGQEEWTRRR